MWRFARRGGGSRARCSPGSRSSRARSCSATDEARLPTRPFHAIAGPMSRFASLVALLLGAAAATGFAPLDWWPVTLIAFAAWLWLVHDAASLKQALWRGWMFGVGHFSVNDNWIQHARSEENTSELQSLMRISYAVFCLKKKTKRKQDTKV